MVFNYGLKNNGYTVKGLKIENGWSNIIIDFKSD